MPHSPDNVKKVSEIGKIKVDQVAIGSCTNSSYEDLMKVAKILKGKKGSSRCKSCNNSRFKASNGDDSKEWSSC